MTRLALALGGGAARGLAHIGVLEVLERAGIRPDCIAGSSMGGLIGALSAAGLRAADIERLARSFRFPRWFIPGFLVEWAEVFPSAVPALSGIDFHQLATPLIVTAVDLERGTQEILHTGPVLPAVRATCAVPGVLPPVRLGGRWLVDGGLVNILPVDAAWMSEPDVIVAVKPRALAARRMPRLDGRLTSLLSRLGGFVPNPATAKVSFEVLVRAAEIVIDRAAVLAAAMAGPELLIEPAVGDIGLRDFHRLDEAVAAGRQAAEDALPALRRLLSVPPEERTPADVVLTLRFDPVCAMVISPRRARASVEHAGVTHYFCSTNCRECFEREPERYLHGRHP
jgi:NTE family protein